MNFKLSSKTWKRNYSSLKHVLSAKAIRARFLEFFINENDHHFINSSPVVSYFDSTIPFINAGMCQFKRVFTGEDEIPYKKVANTQKCIRIGGKHNDLNLIGVDLSHHTFFEMLGNWSFGAYDKKEACKLSWKLLTSAPYNLSPNRLFVTYFGGNEALNLPPDEDVKNIWLELGISPDRILPFGMKENFWEMGLDGPCGTSTEIHVALTDEFCSKSELVNKNNPLLSELWNIVFIKYNKTEHSIEPLSKEYIDTGMGFERLTAVLQEKKSNYDTDLFVPLFDKISQITGAPRYTGSFDTGSLDSSYRCLADFSRMITVAVADNVFPDLSPKLRRILRKALFISSCHFKYEASDRLIGELSKQVAEQLQDVFPEIGNNLDQVNLIVQHENKLVQNMAENNRIVWKSVKLNNPVLESFSFVEYSGLPDAFKYLKTKMKSNSDNSLSAEIVHHLYDTFGLDKPVVEQLCEKLNYKVNWKEVEEFLVNVKDRARKITKSGKEFAVVLNSVGIKTNDFEKFSYRRNHNRNDYSQDLYEFPDVNATLLAILQKDKIISISNFNKIDLVSEELKSLIEAPVKIGPQREVGFVFDKTNFFSTGSGQCDDKGTITIIDEKGNISFTVCKVRRFKEVVVHFVRLCDSCIIDQIVRTGARAVLKVDGENKLNIMRNHTICHLLLLAVKELYPWSFIKQDVVDENRVHCTFRVLGKPFDRRGDKTFIEKMLKKYIDSKLTIRKMTVKSALDLMKLSNCILHPDKIYPPSDIQVISIEDESGKVLMSEVCGGPDLFNTGDIEKIYISEVKMTPSSDLTIEVITGKELLPEETTIINDTERFVDQTSEILNNETTSLEKRIDLMDELSIYVYKTGYEHSKGRQFTSFSIKNNINLLLDLQKKLNEQLRKSPRETIVRELAKKIKQKKGSEKFVVYFSPLFYADFKHDSFKVDIIYRNEFPTMFFNFNNWTLNGVCYVPQSFVTENFNAETWMKWTLMEYNLPMRIEEDMRNYCFMHNKIENPLRVYLCIESLLKNGTDIARERIK